MQSFAYADSTRRISRFKRSHQLIQHIAYANPNRHEKAYAYLQRLCTISYILKVGQPKTLIRLA